MGARKRHSAELRKEIKKGTYKAQLYNNPTSPQKARLVADMIRGLDVNKALNILDNTRREAAGKMRKLLASAIQNWQSKNEGSRVEEASLYVKSITVDGGRVLKRIKTAPQGRANRIKKRSNHISIEVSEKIAETVIPEIKPEEISKPEKPTSEVIASEEKPVRKTRRGSSKKSNIKE